MCGRFAATTDPALLAERIDAIDEASAGGAGFAPSYNVAPTAQVTTVVSRHTDPGDAPARRVRLMRWGLVPSWAKAGLDGAPAAGGPQLINARADRVTESPAFRASARQRRCLVPMDGFYEWRVNPATAAGRKAGKTPFYICRRDGGPLFAAGLWSVWRAPGPPGEASAPLLSCTIITIDAVGALADIHDRMPLILTEPDWDTWLDPDRPADDDLLAGRPDVREIGVREVPTLVNSVRNDGPELIAAVSPGPEQQQLLL